MAGYMATRRCWILGDRKQGRLRLLTAIFLVSQYDFNSLEPVSDEFVGVREEVIEVLKNPSSELPVTVTVIDTDAEPVGVIKDL